MTEHNEIKLSKIDTENLVDYLHEEYYLNPILFHLYMYYTVYLIFLTILLSLMIYSYFKTLKEHQRFIFKEFIINIVRVFKYFMTSNDNKNSTENKNNIHEIRIITQVQYQPKVNNADVHWKEGLKTGRFNISAIELINWNSTSLMVRRRENNGRLIVTIDTYGKTIDQYVEH